MFWSGQRDSNPRSPVPQTGAITRLRYAPIGLMLVADLHTHERTAGCAEASWDQLPMVGGVVDDAHAGYEEHYYCPSAGAYCLIPVYSPEIVGIADICGKQRDKGDQIV